MFFEAPVVHNPLFPFSDENRPSLSEVATLLTGANRVWDGIASTLKHSELTPDFAILHIFVSANLCPVFHTTTVNKDKAYMMFALATNVPIDLGSYIFKTILNAIEKSKKNSSLPFGSLITSLCKEALVRDLPSDHIVPLGPTYNRAAYNKRLTNLQRARNVPNVGVNLGNDPDENVQAPPMQDQGENAFSMENMWTLMNNISARQDELRQTMIAQFQGVNQRLDAIDDRMTFYYNRGEHTHQNVDDNIDVDLDDEDGDDDDDGDDE